MGQLIFTLISCLASGACAAEADLVELKTLMSCLSDPSPTPVLIDLVSTGAMATRRGPGWDDEYCWKLSEPLNWGGLEFLELCVVTDDPSQISTYPDLYWVNSTAPWTEIWLVAEVSRAALAGWAAETLPSESKFEIDPLENGESALSCSEWHFPLRD